MSNKFPLIIAMFLLVSLGAKAQDDYMNTIAAECCKCLSNLSDTLDKDEFYMQLGLCMLKEASPYKKQLKKDYKIDVEKFDIDGERFGELLGMKMALVCPEAFLRLSKSGMLDDEVSEEESTDIQSNTSSTSGIVQKIEEDCFVIFTLKDNTGKITKFYWMSFIDTGYDLIGNYKNLLSKSVEIYYNKQEFFDPKISEYRNFNIITKLSMLED